MGGWGFDPTWGARGVAEGILPKLTGQEMDRIGNRRFYREC